MTKNLIYLLVFAFGFTFVSCDKDNNNESESDVSVNTISVKWEISDSNSPYASFEFNKDGNYIVVEREGASSKSSNTSLKASLFKNNISKVASMRSSESESNLSPIHFGTYQIDGDKIILSGFGLIEVINITAEEFSFSFTLAATGEKNGFVAQKSAELISSSNRTDMLCRTWYCEKVTATESALEEDAERIEELIDEMTGMSFLFSKAGTYLCLYTNGEAGLAEWKWANNEETKFYFSWDNWTAELDEEDMATINQLSANSLVIQDYMFVYHLTLKN